MLNPLQISSEPFYAMPKESPTRFTQEQRCKIITFDGTEIYKKMNITLLSGVESAYSQHECRLSRWLQ